MCRYRSKPTAVNALHFTSTALQWELAELCSQLSAARKYHTHAQTHISHIYAVAGRDHFKIANGKIYVLHIHINTIHTHTK